MADSLGAVIMPIGNEDLLVVCHRNRPYLRILSRNGATSAWNATMGDCLIREAFAGILSEINIPAEAPVVLTTDGHKYFDLAGFRNLLAAQGVDYDENTVYAPIVLRIALDYHNNKYPANDRPQTTPEQDRGVSQSDGASEAGAGMTREQAARFYGDII